MNIHLQYGPISTALRDMAEDDGTWRTDLRWNIAHIVANEFNDYYDWQCEPDYPLFYLFAVAAEREAIAKLADASVNADQYPKLTMLAQAIRMRGD